jgi:hypothetical protein
MARKKRKSYRKLTPEQLAKMQEGKRKAQEERQKSAEAYERYQERLDMLSDLEHDLAKGRQQSKSLYMPKRRRHRHTT